MVFENKQVVSGTIWIMHTSISLKKIMLTAQLQNFKIIFLFLILCFCSAGIDQQKINDVVQAGTTNSNLLTKDIYFIKNEIINDYKFSP